MSLSPKRYTFRSTAGVCEVRVRIEGRIWIALGAALLLTACTRLLAPPAIEAGPGLAPQEAWARVLARHVGESGAINLEALARDTADLERMVAWVYRVAPETHPEQFPSPAHALAFHLNAYNALLLYALLEDVDREVLTPVARFQLLRLRKIQVGGQETTLQAYADYIRQLGDARVLFALNAVTKGGAAMPRQPFVAARLDQQLDHLASDFLGSLRNVQVDRVDQKIWVSELMAVHENAFLAEAPSLKDWINRYRSPGLPAEFALDYLGFDWTLNRPAPAP